MTPDDLDDLTPAERGEFERLPREAAPPAWLESRVVDALRTRGLLRPASHGPGPLRRAAFAALASAAAVAIFAAGLGVGARMNGPAATPPAGPRFVLFLYEDADYQMPEPGSEARRVEEYTSWARDLGRRGLLVDGRKLKETGSLLSWESGPAAHRDVVPASEAGMLAGYFIVAARDAGEAVAVARECPHLKYRGRIAVREIDPV